MANQLYVRCKRRNQTYFLPCERSTSFLQLKEAISKCHGISPITGNPYVPPTSIAFFTTATGEKELPDAGTVSDHEIANDQVLYAVFKKEGSGDQWEAIDVQVADAAAAEKAKAGAMQTGEEGKAEEKSA